MDLKMVSLPYEIYNKELSLCQSENPHERPWQWWSGGLVLALQLIVPREEGLSVLQPHSHLQKEARSI